MNKRIRKVREHFGLSRSAFGEKLGVSGDVVNNLERGRVDAKEPTVKLICSIYSVDRSWLLTGAGGEDPIFVKSDTFSLEQYARDRGASELELAVAKAYFDLPQDVRAQILAKLKGLFKEDTEAGAEPAPAQSEPVHHVHLHMAAGNGSRPEPEIDAGLTLPAGNQLQRMQDKEGIGGTQPAPEAT